MRIALAHTSKVESVAQYLPNNYKVLGRTLDGEKTIVVGIDNAGWTLDAYVIPRLGSGLIHCEEVLEIDDLVLKSAKRGRRRALTSEQVKMVRDIWKENDRAWQFYRSNPNINPKPIHLTVSDLAKRFRVSEGVITDVLNRTGAYTDE